MGMRRTWKFVGLTSVLVAASFLTLAWRNQALVKAERTAEARATMETQSALMASVVRAKTELLINQMTHFVYVRSASRTLHASAQQILNQFEAIALLSVADNKSW